MATPATPAARRKACVECRQQKIRCDVDQVNVPHDPCSRCLRMNLECRILPTSTRNLRQTKAEMRRELEELKWTMRHGNQAPESVQILKSPLPGPQSDNVHSSAGLSSARRTSVAFSGPYTTPSGSHTPSHEGERAGPSRRHSPNHGPTLPRSLDGQSVDPKSIDDCFALFFEQYHPMLPILDPSLNPNDYYDISPFLFWCVFVTGARRYAQCAAALEKFSNKIIPLAFSSMSLRSAPIPVIQGLLILCTWQLSTSTMFKDLTHVLSGAAMNLASQIGLHVAGYGQDFSKTLLSKDQGEMMARAKLWIYCVIVSIRSSCSEGIPPLVIADSFYDGDKQEREDVLVNLPERLVFLHHVHVILLRATVAMSRLDLKTGDIDPQLLRSIISIYNSQFAALVNKSPGQLETFQLDCAWIHLLCFYFFCPSNGPDLEPLARLYGLCISTIETARNLDHSQNFASVCPSFLDRTLTLAAFSILKLSRSQLAPHVDLIAGQRAYFAVIQFQKNNSSRPNDLGNRCATILTQLWSSTKVFKMKDGSFDPLNLRLRARFSMSVNFDMFWYWREEFANQRSPYNADSATKGNPDGDKATTMPVNGTMQAIDTPMSQTLPSHHQGQQGSQSYQSQQPLPTVPAFPFSVSQDLSTAPPPIMGSVTTFQPWNNNSWLPDFENQFPDYEWAASIEAPPEWSAVGLPLQDLGGETMMPAPSDMSDGIQSGFS